MHRCRRAAATALLAALVPLAAGGQTGARNIAGFDHIQTDDLRWNINTGEFSLKDRFTAFRSGTDITADSGNGNSKKKLLHAQGHVVVHQTKPVQSSGPSARFADQPSTLTCDKLDVDGVRKFYTAVGNVHFAQTTRDVTAERGTLDDASHLLHMEGNVHVKDGEQYMDGDVVDYNTATGELHVSGNVLIRQPFETAPPGTPAPKATPKRRR